MTNPNTISLKECLDNAQAYAADLEGTVNHLTVTLEQVGRERDEAKTSLKATQEALKVAREIADGYRQEKAARIEAQNEANNALGDWQDKATQVEALKVEVDRLRSLVRANSREIGDSRLEEGRLKTELEQADNMAAHLTERLAETEREGARLQAELTESLNRERLYLEQRDAYKAKAETFENLADQRWLEIREFEDVRKGYSQGIREWQNKAIQAQDEVTYWKNLAESRWSLILQLNNQAGVKEA